MPIPTSSTCSEDCNHSSGQHGTVPDIETQPPVQIIAQHRRHLRILSVSAHGAYIILAKAQSLGLIPFAYYLYAAQPVTIPSPAHEEGVEAISAKWKETLARMVFMWRMLCLPGCCFFLTGSFAFFQISGVNGSIYARTVAMSVIISAGFGAALSTLYLYFQSNLSKDIKFARIWVEASNDRGSAHSFHVFTLLTLPFSLLIWSTIFSIVTYFTTIFTDPNEVYTPNQSKTTVAAILLCVLTTFYTIPIIVAARCISNVVWNHRDTLP